jgi:hypothetical protein
MDMTENDILNPAYVTDRCKSVHEKFFGLLSRMQKAMGEDEVFDVSDFVRDMEDMKVEIEYLCRI